MLLMVTVRLNTLHRFQFSINLSMRTKSQFTLEDVFVQNIVFNILVTKKYFQYLDRIRVPTVRFVVTHFFVTLRHIFGRGSKTRHKKTKTPYLRKQSYVISTMMSLQHGVSKYLNSSCASPPISVFVSSRTSIWKHITKVQLNEQES